MIQELDFMILDAIQENLKCDVLDFLMPKLTLYAELGILFVAISLIFLLFRSKRKCGAAVLGGLTAGLLLGNVVVKNIAARMRPCWIRPDVSLLIAVPTDYSFPSAHTMHAFIFATVMLCYDRRFGIPALVMAVLVAFSRLYLYVHFPSDVIGGAVIGILIGLAAVFCTNRIAGHLENGKKGRDHAGAADR